VGIDGFGGVIIVQLADQFIEEPHDGVEVETLFGSFSREGYGSEVGNRGDM
jgi:hypothetical protein